MKTGEQKREKLEDVTVNQLLINFQNQVIENFIFKGLPDLLLDTIYHSFSDAIRFTGLQLIFFSLYVHFS